MSQRSGFIVLDKPAGISSAQAISRLQKKLDIEKIGHAGTLDPFATGLLVVLVNRATRLASFATGGQKCYRALFRFGIATDSDDKTGSVLSVSDSLPTIDEIMQIVPEFTGEVVQKPPRISAVKIQGKRAYKRARADEVFETADRTVQIASIQIHEYQKPDLELSITCGSGTYIRSIARDMGIRLGTHAMVMSLRRELSQPFSIDHAVTLEACTWASLIGWDSMYATSARVLVSEEQAKALAGGDQRVIPALFAQGLNTGASEGEKAVFALAQNNASLGVLEYTGGVWKLSCYFGE